MNLSPLETLLILQLRRFQRYPALSRPRSKSGAQERAYTARADLRREVNHQIGDTLRRLFDTPPSAADQPSLEELVDAYHRATQPARPDTLTGAR